MDKRSWLWQRKSSEKSPSGETDSLGSISSLSERFSDDQAVSNHNTQSPEVACKAVLTSEELHDTVKTLSDKLSEALLNIHSMEELVKQHAKVAEEAVSGWEKAETEVHTHKKQVEVITKKNSALEERVGHLDGALKECLRQLRQAREEQEQNIQESITKRNCDWELKKLELENELGNLQTQLETAKTEAVTSTFPDLCIKLEAAERENSMLRLELFSRDEELKLRTSERDLSAHTAETASKQNLENIKKVAKLKVECHKLKMLAHKAVPVSDHKSISASSVCVDSVTDSESESEEQLSVSDNDNRKPIDCEPAHSNLCASAFAELDQFKSEKHGRTFLDPPEEIDLMDDFLEMEKLAALSEAEKGSCFETVGPSVETNLKAELETIVSRTAEQQEELERIQAEKMKLTRALTECQHQLKASRDHVDETWRELVNLKSQIATATEARREAEAMVKISTEHVEKVGVTIVELQSKLAMENESRIVAETDLKATREELVKSRKCLDEMEVNLVQLHGQLASVDKSKCITEAELRSTIAKKEAAEATLKVMEDELQDLRLKVCGLKEEIEQERALSAEAVATCQKLENEISRMTSEFQLWNSSNDRQFKFNQDKELALAASKFAECQRTIASLGEQLKSLATLEDFFADSGDH